MTTKCTMWSSAAAVTRVWTYKPCLALPVPGDRTMISSWTFNLDGMVFTDDSAVSLTGGDGLTFGVAASGGTSGTSMVVYTAKRGTGQVDAMTTLMLNVAELGVMPGGAGTVSVTTVNPQQRALLMNIQGIESPGTHMASYEGAVAVARGLKVTATPKSVTATVANSFQSFGMTGDTPPRS